MDERRNGERNRGGKCKGEWRLRMKGEFGEAREGVRGKIRVERVKGVGKESEEKREEKGREEMKGKGVKRGEREDQVGWTVRGRIEE